jgi:hypothetical protein
VRDRDGAIALEAGRQKSSVRATSVNGTARIKLEAPVEPAPMAALSSAAAGVDEGAAHRALAVGRRGKTRQRRGDPVTTGVR